MCNACPDASLGRRKVLLAGTGLLAAAPFARIAQAQPVAAASLALAVRPQKFTKKPAGGGEGVMTTSRSTIR
jgi:hypothetical protein